MNILPSARTMLVGLCLGLMALPVLETTARAQLPTDFTTTGDGGTGLVITGYTGTVTAVVIPGTIGTQTVTQIAVMAFSNKTTLTSITIPTTVTTIGNNAFFKCSSLTTMSIPASVTSIGFGVFNGCTSLTSITVDPNNPDYVSTADGVLFNKNETALIQCPGAKSGAYVVPATVTSINQGAFSVCSQLTGVTLPAGLTSIGINAFNSCSGLTSAPIPAGVTSIGQSAFYACSGLTSAVFNGSAPTMGPGVFANSATGFTVAYFNSAANFTPGTWNDGSDTYPSANFGATTANSQVTITSYAGPNNVIIPAAMNGLPVTAIKGYAFQNQGSLTSVSFPSSLISIGQFAFQSDSGLTSITIPNGVTSLGTDAFEGCSGVTSISLPSTLTDLESYAFSHCSSLPSIVIPYGVTDIQQNTFEVCTSLTSVTIPASVTSIDTQAFINCTKLPSVIIPSSVTSMGQHAFDGCTALTSATFDGDAPTLTGTGFIFSGAAANFKVTYYAYASGFATPTWNPDANDSYATNSPLTSPFQTSTSNNQITITGYSGSATALDIPGKIGGLPVVAIGSTAFLFDSFTSVSIPGSVTSIGDHAFLHCLQLTSVAIPSSVTSIGDDAFEESGLTSVTIPASAITIGVAPFDQCASLSAITVDPANPNYLSTAEGVLLDKNKTTLIEYPTARSGAYTVPASVTSIGYQAFDQVHGLTSVTLPAGLTSIGAFAFTGCIGLTSIIFPSGVTSIGDSAFVECGLTSVTIPASVTSIGSQAFNLNSNMTSAVFDGDAPATGTGVFANTNSGFTVDYFNNATGFTEPTWKANAGDNYSSAAANYGTSVANNQVTITSYAGPDVVNIPAFANGLPVTSIGSSAFLGAGNLTSVTIPNSVTSLGDSAFEDCIDLSSVNIPTNLLSIGNFAFFSCYSLTSVTLPASVTSIGIGSFAACTALPAITVAPTNPDYVSVNGVVFNTNETTLIQYPAGNSATSYTIPASVTSIAQEAFQSCGNLTSVTIHNGFQSIGFGAFGYCTALTSVTLPATVNSIGQQAFQSCANLTSALFLGNAPTMGSGVFGSVGNGFKVYYYNGATGYTPGNGTWLDTSGDSYPSVDLMATSLTSWIAGFPGTTNTAPGATPENDGVPNLLKYLYDINPSRPMTATDRAALPDFGLDTTTTPGSTYLTLIYRQYAGETGITINVQTSTGLKTWTTLTSGQYTNVPTGAYSPTGDPFMEISVLASSPREFLRLNVTQP